jgi:hypothetical protein
MLPTTHTALKSILAADPSVSVADRARLLALLRNGPERRDAVSAPPEPRLVRRAEAARRLSVSLRAIDNWARAGILRKVKLPGRVRACGFRADEIDAVIRGRESTT